MKLSKKENLFGGHRGLTPETPGVARIKIARSTLAPHQGMTLHIGRAEQEKQIYFDVEWTEVSFYPMSNFSYETCSSCVIALFLFCEQTSLSPRASLIGIAQIAQNPKLKEFVMQRKLRQFAWVLILAVGSSTVGSLTIAAQPRDGGHSIGHRDRNRERDRDRDRNRDRDRDRERERERDRDRNRDREREREVEREREKDRDHERHRDQDRDRDRNNEREHEHGPEHDNDLVQQLT